MQPVPAGKALRRLARLLPAFAWLFAISLLLPSGVRAEEVIERFHSAIAVDAAGAMEVTETIAVRAEGNRIRHGIFRDFPLTFRDRLGSTAHVDFTLLGVTRDGSEEETRTETIDNGIRIYAGSAESEVGRGAHTYVFRYRTARQIRYFDDHDELYWNVTGNGWVFPILSASTEITMPQPVPQGGVTFYTGPLGARGRDAQIVRLAGNQVAIATTRRLEAGEGLSVVVSQPKGAIAMPAARQTALWFLTDNLGAIIGWTGFAALFAYYYRSWSKVGRDPPKGVMVPRWDPPGKLSPALINYVDNKGFAREGWTALSASALQLAVKGYVTLSDEDGPLTIRRTAKPADAALAKGEDVLLAAVDAAGGTFVIDRAHGLTVQSTGRRFRAAIENEHRGRYYHANTGYVIGGVVASAAVIAAAFFLAHAGENVVGLGIAMVVLATVGGTVFAGLGRQLSGSRSLAGKVMAVIVLAFVGFVAITMFSGMLLVAASALLETGGLLLAISAGAIVLLNILFFFLMGAPTPLGRELTDGIEGFRTYMTLAEQDRMNMPGAPKMSPSHFETLLPYAVALGVEKPWSATFETWLATAAAAGAAATYQPLWYTGHGFDSGRISRLPQTMATTIASTIPAPQSNTSSGFSSGGGFSGGGGGGGGGGGW